MQYDAPVLQESVGKALYRAMRTTPEGGALSMLQREERLVQDHMSTYQLMPRILCIQEPVACLLLLMHRPIYRDTGDHPSMMVRAKIRFGRFKKEISVRISDTFPTMSRRLSMASLNRLSQ